MQFRAISFVRGPIPFNGSDAIQAHPRPHHAGETSGLHSMAKTKLSTALLKRIATVSCRARSKNDVGVLPPIPSPIEEQRIQACDNKLIPTSNAAAERKVASLHKALLDVKTRRYASSP